MILERGDQEERTIKLLIGSSIKAVKILKTTSVNTRALVSEETNGTPANGPSYPRPDDWKQLKDALKRWFHESHIPVTENNYGCLLVLNEIVVGPPYKPENCSGTNEMMLWRVRKLLENFYQK